MSSESVQSLERDCAVCLQKCHYPTQLPCGHIFCFLCVKGVAIQSKKCAMCRAEIPSDYLDHPMLLEKISPEYLTTESNEVYQWYYEGRNGWWKYDERSNSELEAAFNSGERECKLLLAGALYCIDFQNMVQVQSSNRTRRRRVKRDTPTLPAKGIAGIKITSPITEPVKTDNNDRSPNNIEQSDRDVIEIISDDSNTADQGTNAETSANGNDLHELGHSMRSVNLQDEVENVQIAEDT